MLVVRVELHSAITGEVTEIARMDIANVGGSQAHGDYHGVTYRGRRALDEAAWGPQRLPPLRWGSIANYPRLTRHVWHLVSRMLNSMGYT